MRLVYTTLTSIGTVLEELDSLFTYFSIHLPLPSAHGQKSPGAVTIVA